MNICSSAPNAITSPWSFLPPPAIQVSTQLDVNTNYQQITKDFIEKFANSCILGMSCTSQHYNADSKISLHIRQNSTNQSQLHELVGQGNLRTKLADIGIYIIKHYNLNYTCQPVGKKSILITLYGKAEININQLDMLHTFLIEINNGSPKITNHMMNIFF